MVRRAYDVLIVGGGIVGCACAHYLASEGAGVTLVDRSGIAAEASGASHGFVDWASGLSRGTLSFVYESIRLLKAAAMDLDDFSLVLDGYLMLAMTPQETVGLRQRYDAARAAGLNAQFLEGEAIRAFEPALSRDVLAALHMADCGHVDPGKMTLAFARAAHRRGARLETGVDITRLESKNDRIVGAIGSTQLYAADHVILAAGAWSSALAASVGLSLPVEPGKGQMLATEPLPPITSRVLNSSGAGVRQDRHGVAFIGSTLEYVGFDKTVSAAANAELLADAARIVPALILQRDFWLTAVSVGDAHDANGKRRNWPTEGD